MDPALSRRAGRAMSSRTFLFLDQQTRDAFVKAVTNAKNFNDLDGHNQALIIAAENEPETDPVLEGTPEPATKPKKPGKKS